MWIKHWEKRKQSSVACLPPLLVACQTQLCSCHLHLQDRILVMISCLAWSCCWQAPVTLFQVVWLCRWQDPGLDARMNLPRQEKTLPRKENKILEKGRSPCVLIGSWQAIARDLTWHIAHELPRRTLPKDQGMSQGTRTDKLVLPTLSYPGKQLCETHEMSGSWEEHEWIIALKLQTWYMLLKQGERKDTELTESCHDSKKIVHLSLSLPHL